ncbi:hypothetical protein LINPERPRIM_LOCUS28059 [Linum perenne]
MGHVLKSTRGRLAGSWDRVWIFVGRISSCCRSVLGGGCVPGRRWRRGRFLCFWLIWFGISIGLCRTVRNPRRSWIWRRSSCSFCRRSGL